MGDSAKLLCATVALAGTWGEAAADSTLTLTTNRPLEDVSGFFYYNSSVYREDDSKRFVREFDYGDLDVTTNTTGPHLLEVVEDRGEPINYRFPYTLMGVYDASQGFVSILLRKGVADDAIARGLFWNDVFSPEGSAYVSESQVAVNLQNGFFPEIGRFMEGYGSLFPRYNEEAVLVHFSGATRGGTGFASAPVPEPALLAALGIGATALLRRRRKA